MEGHEKVSTFLICIDEKCKNKKKLGCTICMK
jgi:hypothetical protein